MGRARSNQLGSAISGKSGQEKKTRKASTLRKLPISVTSTSLPEGLCSRNIYPTPTQMSFPDQLLEGQAAPNSRPVPRAPSPSASAGLSSLISPPSKPYRTLAHDPARGQGCPSESAGGCRPGLLAPPEGIRPWVGWGRPETAGGGLTVRGDRRPHLDPDFIGGEAASADPHRLRVAHIDLKEVAGRPVGVIQVLRLGDQPPGVRHRLRHFAVAAAAAGSLRPRRVPPMPPLLAAAGTPGSRAAVARRTST